MSALWVVISVFVLICISVAGTKAQVPPSCGETFTNETGTLQSVNYPFSLKVKSICEWNFNIPTKPLVYLNVRELLLAVDDIITINDGVKSWVYDTSNVSETLLMVLNSNGSSVKLSIGANTTNLPRRSMASYTTEVNEMYTGDGSGWIKSPIFSKRNDPMMFKWIITQKPDESIYLSFKTFNISEGALEIDDGRGTHLHYNGSQLPNDVITSNANVELTLNSSMNDEYLGFEMHYSRHHPGNCSRVVNIENTTELIIPFDEPQIAYPVKCFVIVEGPPDAVFSVGIQSADQSKLDANTMVELNDGGSRYSRNLLLYSPTSQLEAPPNILTSSNRLWIGYVSVPPGKKSLNVTAFITLRNSGKSLYNSGTYELPRRPENETLSSNTSAFILSVKSSQQVLTVVHTNATLGVNNSILFYDGANTETLLANFTADSKLHEVISTGTRMLVIANNFRGNETFTASFSGYPEGRNLLSSKRLGSHQMNNIEGNTSYFWIISPLGVNSSEIIALTLGTLRLDSGVVLMIYNGTSESPSSLLFSLSSSVTNRVINVPALNGARLVLRNVNDNSTDVIVDASYLVDHDYSYSINMTSGSNATITSPYYPNLYPANANCSWMIKTSKTLLVTVEYLNVPLSQPILIYGNSTAPMKLIASISGDQIPDDIYIFNETYVLITFLSSSALDNVTVSTGFKIVLRSLDCGEKFNGTVKDFQTPSYPKAEINSTYCVWTIVVPDKKGDDVEILNVSYRIGDEKSSPANLEYHEGGSLQSPLAKMVNSTGFLSRTNKLLVAYKYVPTKNAGGQSYKFTYDVYACNPEHQCKNGVCMHDGWRCNGINECGDFTDESYCAQSPIVAASTGGVSVATFVVVMFLMLFIGIGVAFGGPLLWRKIRSHNSYQEFRNTADA